MRQIVWQDQRISFRCVLIIALAGLVVTDYYWRSGSHIAVNCLNVLVLHV